MKKAKLKRLCQGERRKEAGRVEVTAKNSNVSRVCLLFIGNKLVLDTVDAEKK